MITRVLIGALAGAVAGFIGLAGAGTGDADFDRPDMIWLGGTTFVGAVVGGLVCE